MGQSGDSRYGCLADDDRHCGAEPTLTLDPRQGDAVVSLRSQPAADNPSESNDDGQTSNK